MIIRGCNRKLGKRMSEGLYCFSVSLVGGWNNLGDKIVIVGSIQMFNKLLSG